MAFSNELLTPELASVLGGAMGTFLDPKAVVMVARDYRRDSRMLKRSFSGGLMGSGVELIDLHAVPTNVLQFSVRRFGADAGVMITRSHNLAGMVSIKLFDSTGIEYPSEKVYQIADIADKKEIRRAKNTEVGWISVADAMKIYDRALASFFAESQQLMKDAKMRVVIDCSCGPASLILPDLLNEFGCEVITLNAHRPRNPQFLPNPESLIRLRETVRATNSDLGIALDPESRHAVIIDEQGRIRTAEETASVNLHSRYDPDPNATVVVGETVHPSVYQDLNKNIILSSHKEPGGSARLVMSHRAIYGFNDTGLFFLPVFAPGSDAIVAALTVLTQMAREPIKSTDLYRRHQIFPQRTAVVTFPLDQMLSFFTTILNTPPKGYYAIDTFIGIKLITENKEWIHFYLSNEENSLQIEIFDPQSKSDKQEELINFARSLIDQYLNISE
jgi:phosphomannomutase